MSVQSESKKLNPLFCHGFWNMYLQVLVFVSDGLKGQFHIDPMLNKLILVAGYKGLFFSENLMGLKKICQITILNLNF